MWEWCLWGTLNILCLLLDLAFLCVGGSMREGEDVVCKENLNSPIVGSQLGRKLWYPEDSVKTSYLLASVQHLDTGAGGGDFWRLLSMLELLEVGTGIPDPFNARLIAFSSSTLDNQMISLANDRSRIIGFLMRHKIMK